MSAPVQVYSAATPNGMKITIALEEMGVEYKYNPVQLGQGEQKQADFLRKNPNGKIPAIVDPNGPKGTPFSVFESGAILLYLAQKYNKLWSADQELQSRITQWVFWQNAGLGPNMGQANHFKGLAEPIPYALNRFVDESKRLFAVLEKQLETNQAEFGQLFVVGPEFSIADATIFPWVRGGFTRGADVFQPDNYPLAKQWVEQLSQRPGVQRGTKATQQ